MIPFKIRHFNAFSKMIHFSVHKTEKLDESREKSTETIVKMARGAAGVTAHQGHTI